MNQLNHPEGIDIDDEQQIIYIADFGNHRIIEWKFDANCGQVIAEGNGQGNRRVERKEKFFYRILIGNV